MFFRSIQWRLVFILFLITFVLITVVWVFLNLKVERSFYDSFKNEIAGNYASLQIQDTIKTKELENRLRTDPVITGLILGTYKSFTMIDKNTGEVLYSSDPVYQDIERQPEFRAAIFRSVNLLSVMDGDKEGITPQHTPSQVRGLDDFYNYVRFQPTQDRDVILFFKYSRDNAVGILNEFNGMIATSLLVALSASLAIGLLLSRTITKPITDVMHKAESITAGEFGQLLEVKSMDEIGKLTDTFNFMSTRLKNMLTEISAEKSKVEAVINHMMAGVIAFDKKGIAIHVNHAANQLIATVPKTRKGKAIGNPIRFSLLMEALGIDEPLQPFFKLPEATQKSIILPVGDKYLRIQFAVFSGDSDGLGGLILVLQDMTDEQRLENMRREFVANVSHELRTPLTSVKSYTETLLDGAMNDPEILQKFLKVINEETDRMVHLVRDLLTLSHHDSGLKIVFDDVDPDKLVNGCVDRLRHAAEEKSQALVIERKENVPAEMMIKGDFDRLEQLLLNIVGNAIKYTPTGGTVKIIEAIEAGKLAIQVKDTGIGIPKQDLSRIFERFYRVDKARSRQMGGTGLGLAIAKEIVEIHNGSIYAESVIGEGTIITILLPLTT